MILDQWQQVCDAQTDSGGAAGVSFPDLPGPGVLPLLLPGAPPSHIQARLPRNINKKKNITSIVYANLLNCMLSINLPSGAEFCKSL